MSMSNKTLINRISSKYTKKNSYIYKKSKYSKEYLMQLFQYSFGEDIANAVTHGVGGLFSLGAIVSLSWVAGRYGDWLDSFSMIFYGFSMLFMFTMSTIYHSMVHHTARSVFKKLDHISIYCLIVGTYTPIVFSLLKNIFAYWTYIFIGLIAVAGVVFKAFFAGKFKVISTLIYIIMGCSGFILLPSIINVMSSVGVGFFFSGGIIYIAGTYFYLSKFKYSHMIWHILVLFAVVFQYIAIAFFILQQ